MKKLAFIIFLCMFLIGSSTIAEGKAASDEKYDKEEAHKKLIEINSTSYRESGDYLPSRINKEAPERNCVDRDGILLYHNDLYYSFFQGATDIDDVLNNYLNQYYFYDVDSDNFYYEPCKQRKVIFTTSTTGFEKNDYSDRIYIYDWEHRRFFLRKKDMMLSDDYIKQYLGDVDIYDKYIFVTYTTWIYYKTNKGDYLYISEPKEGNYSEFDEFVMPAKEYIYYCKEKKKQWIKDVNAGVFDIGYDGSRGVYGAYGEMSMLSMLNKYNTESPDFDINYSVSFVRRLKDALIIAAVILILAIIIVVPIKKFGKDRVIGLCKTMLAKLKTKMLSALTAIVGFLKDKRKKIIIGICVITIIIVTPIVMIPVIGNIINIIENNIANHKKHDALINASVGDYVYYGNYNDKDIEWRVLAREGNRVLVITKDAVTRKKYEEQRKEAITWEECTLREWLNNEFLKEAFNSGEQARIEITNVTADKNPKSPVNPGNDTQDKVFLLSIVEANKYFESDSDRVTRADDTWVNRWWLRSPGTNDSLIACVNQYGKVSSLEPYTTIDIRPAMWINLEN